MKNEYSRVMFVTNSLSGGGAERATNTLINALSDFQVKVSLIAVNDGPDDLIAPRCEIFELHRQWQGGLVSVFKAYIGMQKAIWRWKPNFLVLNCDIPELLGSITIGKHKLVAVEHASQPWPQRQPLGKFIRKLLRFRKTRWVAVSDHLKVWGSNLSPDFVINNPINLLDIQVEEKKNYSVNEIRRLVFVGRLSSEKNPILLVSVAKDVNLPVLFIGSGVQSEIVRELCKLNGVNVSFSGFVKDPWAETQSGDLLIIPSNNEGDGLVIVEAIQRGIPLVARDIPDLARFGLLNTNYFESSTELVDKIESCRQHLNQFIVSTEIVDLVLSKRNPELVAEKWLQVLR